MLKALTRIYIYIYIYACEYTCRLLAMKHQWTIINEENVHYSRNPITLYAIQKLLNPGGVTVMGDPSSNPGIG